MNAPMPPIQRKFHRFFILVELLDLQRTTFHADLSGSWKMRFNSLNTHLQGFRNDFLRKANTEAKEGYEDLGAMAWEVLDEWDKAENKSEILALMRCYNAGQVKLITIKKPHEQTRNSPYSCLDDLAKI